MLPVQLIPGVSRHSESAMNCRYCGEDRKLIKAHAVPEAFFRVLRDGGETPIIVTNTLGKYTNRSPIGVYVAEILCESCEKGFGSVDDYGARILIQNSHKDFMRKMHEREIIAFESDDIDQQKIRIFTLSILWLLICIQN